MDKCLYKDKLISAEDFANSFESETELRKNTRFLICCDPECQSELIFRNGPKKTAHFAHKNSNSQCCYIEYDSQMDKTKKKIRDEIFEQMNKSSAHTGYNANFDVRISKEYRHITPVTLCGDKRFAIDIMYCNKSVNDLERMNESYKSIGYLPIPVIIEDISDHFNDMTETYYTFRYWLHNSDIQKLIIYNPEQKRYYMCRLDSDTYDFNGISTDIELINVFVMPFNLFDLGISDCGFYTPSFENAYNEWKHTKRRKLEDLFNQEQNKTAKQKEKQLEHEIELKCTLMDEGMFVDIDNGKIVKITIEDVTIVKGKMRHLREFSDDEIKENMDKIFNGDISMFRKMLNVMLHPCENERSTFKKLYDYYFSMSDGGTKENIMKFRILEHIKAFTQLSF